MKKNIKVISSLLAFVTIISSLATFSINVSATTKIDADVYRKKENDYMKIALTFDDGPHPRYTPQILNILEKYNVKATFFIVGINAHYYPDTLVKVANSGHEIGNHTYTHPRVSTIERQELISQVEKCETEIYGITECKTKNFRPPEGMLDNSILSVLKSLDYKVILWDIDTRDWDHTPANEIAENVVDRVSSGDIILMHDYIDRDSPTPEALNIFLPILIEKGYKFVTVSELIGLQ